MAERPDLSSEEWTSVSPVVKGALAYLLNSVNQLVTTRASEMQTLDRTVDT